MQYNSTRNSSEKVSASKAIVQGISRDGGLFVPDEFPQITLNDLQALADKSYVDKAVFVLSKYLDDFSEKEIQDCAAQAYTAEKFESDQIAQLHKLTDSASLLELWHGPTCAFKDMALQILPHLLTVSAKKQVDGKEIIILVATSGDTGKAALEGFKDVEGTKILVFYPEDGVSAMQKRQMVTQEGGNVNVCAIKGNFDDAQTGVKNIFANEEIGRVLQENNSMFSSANSINWGRLVPQIVYYVSSYCELVKSGEIQLGEKINITVPTGNFGNILAAYYAKEMGLPVNKFICASNANNILTDFINTGVYDKNREFITTVSPSMDILISSNLERLLYLLSGNNDEVIKELFAQLNTNGKYTVDETIKSKLQDEFAGGCCDDRQTKETIKAIYDQYGYVCDTHTAVAVKVYQDYQEKTGDGTKTIIASTASPYKFTDSVLDSLGEPLGQDEFAGILKLHEISKLPIPNELSELKQKKVRFKETVAKEQMKDFVLQQINKTWK